MFQEALNEKGKELFPFMKFFPDFYLAGGTSLALQIGHRISVDFDFFSEEKIPSDLLDKVKNIFEGFSVIPSVNNSDELTVFVDEVKITFLYYPFSVLKDLILLDNIKMLSVGEIAATKAYTIGRRGSFKDYVDLYYILKEGHVSLAEIIKLSEKKYGDIFNARLFLEQMLFFDDVENAEIIFLKKSVSKEEIKSFFQERISEEKLL